jgi:hypothetical protein
MVKSDQLKNKVKELLCGVAAEDLNKACDSV